MQDVVGCLDWGINVINLRMSADQYIDITNELLKMRIRHGILNLNNNCELS